jgi:hypothetical protein
MANIFLIVEGQTEEQFYKNILKEYYVNPDGSYRHFFYVIVMPTKKNIYSRKQKGGRITYQACVDNVRRFLAGASHANLVMLVLDYYGLDPSFKDNLSGTQFSLDSRVDSIQDRLENDINDKRFKFRLQVHEFEAFLFSDPVAIADHFKQPSTFNELQKILNTFDDNPELINDNPKTAPSKRLDSLYGKFGKTTDGLIIARNIGIEIIRGKCRRFDKMCSEIDKL